MAWHVGGVGHMRIALLWDLRSGRHNMIVMKPIAVKYLWENSTDLLDQVFSYSATFLQSLKWYWKLEIELVHGTFIVQTVSWELRVIMKFREWMLSKGYFSMGTIMKTKRRLLYHRHSDDQAKVTDCTMGTVFVEDQVRVTVPWAHCWGPSTYVHRNQKGSNPLIILFYSEDQVKVSVPWAHGWDPRKCHYTLGTVLRAKQRLLSHVHSVEGQEKVTVPWAHCWDPRKCHHTVGTVLRAKRRLLSHVHSAEGQGKLLYHGHSVESQAKVTVTCAQCWGPKTLLF